MNTSLVQSVKAQIKNLAAKEGRSFAALWHTMVLERLLARIARSKHANCLVFKGGLLLSKYIPISRETVDIDFSAHGLVNRPDNIAQVFRDIISIDPGDAFRFENLRVRTLSHPAMAYEGIRILTTALFGNTRTHLQIDLGFDHTTGYHRWEVPLMQTQRGPLFESHAELQCYTRELIFAEKLQTAVARAGSNSRMKDYQDLFSLISTKGGLIPSEAKRIVPLVFGMRKTSCRMLPVNLAGDDLNRLENAWKSYLASSHFHSSAIELPQKFNPLLERLNQWLSEHLCPL